MWLTDLLNLFFPNLCQACGQSLIKNEKIICLSCLFKLPKTNFHIHEDNPISQIFLGRVNINTATSFLFFNKGGNVQKLIHQLKYKGNTETGLFLGELLGSDLKKSSLYSNIDIIVPVPLHQKKLHKRGFNQSEIIAEGMSKTMNLPVNTNSFYRLENTETQTKKSRYTRWENVKNKFGVLNSEKLEGKHILLVDDVLTTGATLESCANSLLEIPQTTISIVTLAYAQV